MKRAQAKLAEEKEKDAKLPKKVKAAPAVDKTMQYLNDNQFKLKTRIDPSILSTFFLEKFQEDLKFWVSHLGNLCDSPRASTSIAAK